MCSQGTIKIHFLFTCVLLYIYFTYKIFGVLLALEILNYILDMNELSLLY